MRRRLAQRFGNLRWKLTWSYVWVTLVISMLINCAAFALILGSNPIPTPQLLHELQQSHAQDLAVLWEDNSPPSQQLQNALRFRFGSVQSTTSGQSAAIRVGLSLQINYDDPQLLERSLKLDLSTFETHASYTSTSPLVLVTDPAGVIIAGNFPQQFAPGSLISDPEVANAQTYIAAARADQATPPAYGRSGNRLVAATPIKHNGAVVAVLYMHTRPFEISRWIVVILVVVIFVVTFVVTGFVNGLIGMIYGYLAARPYARRLQQLSQASAAVAQGDFAIRIDDPSADEIGQLGRQFNTMADQLAANMHALRALADHNAALAEQAAQLAIVEERHRLARELHDSVSQELFSVTMLAAAAQNLLTSQPQRAAEHLVQLRQMAQRALQETRALIFALRPAALGDRGLAQALRQLCSSARERQALDVDLQIEGERRLPLEQEQTLFRIVQEALANVVRHSGVQQAQVGLRYSDHETQLTISDKGKGFDTQAARPAQSLGLISIAERVAAIGGTWHITSALGAGTRIDIHIPRATESSATERNTP